MKTGFTDAELKAAYDSCVLMKSHCDNVLATAGFENSKSDKEWSQMAGKFIKAYERVNANKLAKSGKAGFMGEALLMLDKLQSDIKKIK